MPSFQDIVPDALDASPLLGHFPSPILAQPSEAGSITQLIRLYFTSVHYFGYLSFIHETDFWNRYDRELIPEELSLLMAANALRYGGQMQNDASLQVADAWVDGVATKLLPQVLTEFGAIELMAVILCQHYDFMRGKYSRGYVIVGIAVKMLMFLRLNSLDDAPPLRHKPLLSAESLRRLAWSVYFMDATVSGGVYGHSTIAPGCYTIQLPSDEITFKQHSHTVTDKVMPLIPALQLPDPPLGLGAHLIRAITARQILAGLHTQLQKRQIPDAEVQSTVDDAERRALALLDSLPSSMTYTRAQYIIHRGQSPLLLALHVMRNTARRHLSLLRIAAAKQIGKPDEADIPIHRTQMIADAKHLSAVFRDALELGVPLDPQMAMHAYNGFEILLYQPVQSIGSPVEIDISLQEVEALLTPFVDVIRRLARVSHLVWLIYPETINRMIRKGYVDGLTNDDIMAVLKKLHSISNADAEFNFEDSFWRYEVSLARLHGVQPPQGSTLSLDEALLELHRPGTATLANRGDLSDILRSSQRADRHTATVPVATATTAPAGPKSNLRSTDLLGQHEDPRGLDHVRDEIIQVASEQRQNRGVRLQPHSFEFPESAALGPAPAVVPAPDITPIERLQTMFHEVRSRAASPVRSPPSELDQREANSLDTVHAADDIGAIDAEMDPFDFTLMPFLADEQLPFTWNFWDEQGLR